MNTRTAKPIVLPGTIIGIGMGGFLDGIIIHQLLQTHNMLSARLPKDSVANMEINMFWDGLFHAFTWLMVALGLVLQWHAAARGRAVLPGVAMWGSLLLEWGLFNLVEGVVDHHLLGLHHVRDLPVHLPLYDWIFLGIGGAGFIGVGRALAGSRARAGYGRVR